jgi:sugar phosphate isomerase/epimerase
MTQPAVPQHSAISTQHSSRITLSGFGDEISDELTEQLDTLDRAGIRRLDLRGVWGRNVLDLTDAQVDRLRAELDARGMSVSCVASPVGKAPVDGDVAQQQAALARALAIARQLDAPSVRIFSYYLPAGDAPERWRGVVLERLGALVRQAEEAGLILLHENETGIYGDSPARCHELHTQLGSPRFLALWDPGNFAACGYRPFTDSFHLLRPYIADVHVKDFDRASGRVVVAGAGDAQWRECLAALRDAGYAGNFALEPHLAHAGPAGGFTGPELFLEALNAFTALLDEAGFEPEQYA